MAKKKTVVIETIRAKNDVVGIAQAIAALESARGKSWESPETMVRTVAAYYGYRIVKLEQP